MDLRFTDEQRDIARLADAVFADFCDDLRVRRFHASGAPFDAELWAKLTDVGLTDLLRPEMGGGALELMLVLESQGRRVAPVPLWPHVLALGVAARFGDAALLAHLDASGHPVGIAVEPLQSALAVADRDGWRLHGQLGAVSLTPGGEWLIAPAEAEGVAELFAIRLRAAGAAHEGFTVTELGVLTNGAPICSVAFDGARVEAASRLQPGASAWLAPRMVAAVAALQLGVAEEALHRTAAYVSQRRQFGRPIGSFQAVAVRMADAYIDVEALRSTLWRLCWALDAGVATPGDVEVAKIWAADCGHRVAHAAQHLHGGIGADLSYPLHRFFLWARALEMTLGGASIHRTRLGDWLAESADPRTVFVDA